MSRVNCQANGLKGRYARGRGLLALADQGRVFAIGWVIIGLLFIGRTLGIVGKCRDSRHGRVNGRSKF